MHGRVSSDFLGCFGAFLGVWSPKNRSWGHCPLFLGHDFLWSDLLGF